MRDQRDSQHDGFDAPVLSSERRRAVAHSMNRRNFLKGAACSAALFGAFSGLSACGLQEQGGANASSQAHPSTDAASSKQGEIIKAQEGLISQDSHGFAATTNCPTLFTSFTVGSHTIENRIFKPSSGTSSISGTSFSPSAYDYFGTLADGGCKFIAIDSINAVDLGEISKKKPTVRTPEGRADAKKFTDHLHAKGATVLTQISGSWTKSSSGTPLASFYENAEFDRKEMSKEDIISWQDAAARGCAWLKEAGFDGVDINASCDHMFASFLSRFFNKRSDEYGPQSLENRARFLTETIQKIRSTCGKDFIIEVLFSGIEGNFEFVGDDGLCTTVSEAKGFAQLIEKAGADMIQVRSSFYGNHAAGFFTDLMHVPAPGHTGYATQYDFELMGNRQVKGDLDGACALIDIAAEIKQAVSIPVGPVGDMDPRLTPDLIDTYLKEGKIDFIATNRSLIADPQWPNKLKAGNRDDITPCNKCLTCFTSILPPSISGAKTCRVNPTFAKLDKDFKDGSALKPAATQKHVVVAGGGPAGMEAARVLRLRGHNVTLLESTGSLGGLLPCASIVKGPHEKIYDYETYLKSQMEKLGVTVKLDSTATKDTVAELKPDAVIVATGGVHPSLSFKGADKTVPLMDAIEGKVAGDSYVLVGDNVQATDTATMLIKQGKRVTLVCSSNSEQYDLDHPSWPRWQTRRWCQSKGMSIHFESQISEVRDKECVISAKDGTQMVIPCDVVINSERMTPQKSLVDELKQAGYETFVIGDAESPSTISHATYTAHMVARTL